MSTSSLFIITFSGSVLGLIILLILAFGNRKFSYPNRLLALSIFGLAYLMFVSGLIWSGSILKFPHFFRTASPVIYLIAPAAFLYVRSTLEEESEFQAIDGLHFLPALLHFLEMAPFYLQSAETKIDILKIIAVNPDYSLAMYEGILPPNAHAYLKTGLGLIYFGVQFYLIKDYVKENAPLDDYQEKVMQWLNWFTLVLMVCYLSLLIGLFANTPDRTVHYLLTSLIGAAFLIILVYLFFQPQILYGLSSFSKSENLVEDIKSQYSTSNDNRNLSLSEDMISEYQRRIEEYMEKEKPFLNRDFRMRNMVEDTGISRHHLSAVINTVYNKNFNRLVNEYRVKYIKNNIDNPEWSNLTLEGIGMEAGFKSRSTFLQAFKKETGMTPSEFREKAFENSPKSS